MYSYIIESNNVRIHLNKIIDRVMFDYVLLIFYNAMQRNTDVSPESCSYLGTLIPSCTFLWVSCPIPRQFCGTTTISYMSHEPSTDPTILSFSMLRKCVCCTLKMEVLYPSQATARNYRATQFRNSQSQHTS